MSKSNNSIVKISSIANQYDCTKAHIYSLIKKGKFPKGTKLKDSRSVVWKQSVVDEWIMSQMSGD